MDKMLHKRLGRFGGAVVLGVAALGYAGASQAGCVDASKFLPAQEIIGALGSPQAHFIRAAYGDDQGVRPPAIVGLWKFEMISKSTSTNTNPMPDGTLVDFGTAVWHRDGTELQTSGIRNPSDGDVCQGVWQQVDDNTFVLNHIALAWTAGSYTGPVRIRARVTVDASRTHYSGTFSTVVHLASATTGHEFDETTVLASITGTFTGTRVTEQ